MIQDLQFVIFSYLTINDTLPLLSPSLRDKFIKIHKPPIPDLCNAIVNGELQTVKYLVEIQGTSYSPVYIMIQYDQSEILKYFIDLGYITPNPQLIEQAIDYGSLKVLKYLFSIGLKPEKFSIFSVIANDNVEIVKFLYSEGYYLNTEMRSRVLRDPETKISKFLIDLHNPRKFVVPCYNRFQILEEV